MAAGVTQPGGAGTTIYIYDDASSASGLGYTFAEISAAFPADFVDLGTERKVYASAVTLQVGDTGTGTATTTLVDTSSDVYFASGKSLQYRATQTTSWVTSLGTKVGSGNVAGSKQGCALHCPSALAMRGKIQLYGCRITLNSASACAFQPNAGDGSELIDVHLENLSTGTFSIAGGATVQFTNIYNVRISSGATAATVTTGLGSAAVDRFTISAAAAVTNFQAITANVELTNLEIHGDPTTSDIRWTGLPATNWKVIRPAWSQLAPKFAIIGAGSISVANGAKEYWPFNVKVVGSTGAAIANIPVTLTDTLGNAQVSTTTDANGRISFGTAPTANHVIVMDHYTVTGTYNQRHRSPFLLEVNTGNSKNSDYQSLRIRFNWPGYEGITTSAGTFEDLNVVVPLATASGAPTSWVEAEMP